jgi:transposase
VERTAGIDLASEEHRLVVVDADGRKLEEQRIAHSEDGISALVRRLLSLDVARVAIEQPNGLVVDRLLDAGIAVVAVHPNQLAAARERYRSGGGKSDGFDAYVLAELARTGMHRLRLLAPDSDETRALRALTRAREDLVEQRVALANQLRAQLEAFWPGAKRIFAEVDSLICLAFLERYPSPEDARLVGEKRLACFLARNGYCGRKSTSELLGRLRAAPAGRTGELEREARRAVVLGLVAALKPLVKQIKRLTSEIRGPLSEHPDGEIFRSLFRDPKSVVTAAELLAEIGDRRERHANSASLEAIAGQSAVAVESGKRKVGSFRWACNKTLRSAVGVLADSSRKHNPWAQKIYADAIARGKDHPHALRILGRAWLRVIWRMWQDRQPYDPNRHRSLNRLLAAQGGHRTQG